MSSEHKKEAVQYYGSLCMLAIQPKAIDVNIILGQPDAQPQAEVTASITVKSPALPQSPTIDI